MSNVRNRRWWAICIALMLLVVLLSAALLMAFWRSRWQTVVLDEVSQPADFEFHARPGDLWPSKFVNRLDVIVTGEIDGAAEMLIDGEDPVKLSGNVQYERGGDWYDSDCRIRYEPTKVKSGHLKIRCRFRGL